MRFINFIIFIFLIKSIENVNILVYKSELKNKPRSLISVNTDLGTIIGYKQNVSIPNLINNIINVFYGVPYAEVPVGKLRFKKPKPISKYPGDPYLALDFKPHCTQNQAKKYNKNDKFNEDCLYMNIWTPNLETKKNNQCTKKYNVMVYIYGGYSSIYQMNPFETKDNTSHLSYNGEFFASLYDTILITINFRQHLFGNLYLDNEYPANLALHDQNLAIKWVKENMKSFCGADNITVFGNSFGSIDLSVHLVSKYSKNLISNAIMHSSSGFFQYNAPVTRNQIMLNSFLVIHNLGCTNLTTEKINEKNIHNLDKKIKIKYFKYLNGRYLLKEKMFLSNVYENWNLNIPDFDPDFKIINKMHKDSIQKDGYLDRDIVKLVKFLSKYTVDLKCMQEVATEKLLNLNRKFSVIDWTIYYDNDFIDMDAYLHYKLFNKLNTNKDLNILIGNVKDESVAETLELLKPYYTDQFNAPVLKKEEAKDRIMKSQHAKIFDNDTKRRISNFYTNESRWELPRGYYDAIVNFRSDKIFNCPNYQFSSYVSMTANRVYNFFISYQPTKHFGSQIYHLDLSDYAWIGNNHGDEINYIFGLPFKATDLFTDLDRKFSLKLIKLWTSFSKNGKMPKLTNGSKWPYANRNNLKPKYIEINSHFLRERKFEFEERCDSQLWRNFTELYKR